MATLRPRMHHLPTLLLMAGAIVVCVLGLGGLGMADMYGDSAHGNTDPGYGVNRTTATCENWPGGVCQIGDCAHCAVGNHGYQF